MRQVFLTLFVSLIIASPLFLLAQGPYVSHRAIIGIPGYSDNAAGTGTGIGNLINVLYALSISLAALLAVIKIIIAGVKWMLTDVVTQKSEARKDIEGALLGLLVVISAVLILTTINPNLTSLEIIPTP